MNRPLILLKPPSDHMTEIALLGIISIGVIMLAKDAIAKGSAGEASAWTAVLMAIINAIKERWTQRSLDRMGANLANAPAVDPRAPDPKG